ncbi:hypothetical protein O9992_05215 [Vibrio lentus]|nr:hypothetical protein [Vibrio lentus]
MRGGFEALHRFNVDVHPACWRRTPYKTLLDIINHHQHGQSAALCYAILFIMIKRHLHLRETRPPTTRFPHAVHAEWVSQRCRFSLSLSLQLASLHQPPDWRHHDHHLHNVGGIVIFLATHGEITVNTRKLISRREETGSKAETANASVFLYRLRIPIELLYHYLASAPFYSLPFFLSLRLTSYLPSYSFHQN